MDIKEYISSGILEQYVLQTTSDQERKEVECMSHIYPEIKEELTKLQETFELVALANSIEPAPKLKDKIWAEIQKMPLKEEITPAADNIIPLNPISADKKTNPWSTFNIAASALLVVSLIALLSIYNNYEKTSDQLSQAVMKSNELENNIQSKQQELDKLDSYFKLLTDSSVKSIRLSGTPNYQDYKAIVYWNPTASSVYILPDALPKLPADKEYQLWGIVNGKPVSGGMLDQISKETRLQKMLDFPSAQAFAITIEKKGGSQNPTMEQLVVIGNI